jgi:D-alanyl-D-alanine carboxypeptidase (penicillin-binding protein 5/6)
MTAYVSLNDLSLNKEVTVANFNLQSGDATMGIQPGETLAFHSLLKGLLINSGSDAAQAIAIADAGSVDAFVAKMNKATTDLGLKNTHFSNPVGWDDGNNYSSARDMAGLARVMLNNQTVRKIVKSPYDSVTTSGGRSINLANTDILLADPNYIGVKTGYTPGAGECLISLNVGTGREILTVVIGSGDRFGQTRAFFDWLNANFMLK